MSYSNMYLEALKKGLWSCGGNGFGYTGWIFLAECINVNECRKIGLATLRASFLWL